MVSNTPLESDLSLFLDPIPGENPCGESLRYTDIYDKIREARREDDEKLPQGVWKTEIKKANWEQLSHLCQEALKSRSKDLQIAAWLTEAWLHLDGMGGLERGLELILLLTRNFWDKLYPQINKDGYELRIIPYEWINTRLSEESFYVLISMPSDRASHSYTLMDYNEASRLELTSRTKGAQQAEGKKPSLAKVSLSIDQTSTAFYRYIDESCTLCVHLMKELEEELRYRIGNEAPAFYHLREKVDSIQRFAQRVLDERGEKKKTKEVIVSEKPKPPHKKQITGPIESREQAYAILKEVANYLERIEPHSPTPYLIHRAISWGGMNLSEVFADTLHNGKDMSLLMDILNVRKES